jgi:hypothetical protein
VTLDEGSAKPAQRADQPTVLVKQPGAPIAARLIKAALGLTLIIVTVAAVTYATVVSTILAFPIIDGQPVITVRGAYPLGKIPTGTNVTVIPEPVDRTLLGKASDILGIPRASVVTIVTGPFNKVTQGPNGTIVTDGQPTTYTGTIANQQLNNEYLALCLLGPCGTPGDAVLINPDQIVGAARGTVAFTGVTELPPQPGSTTAQEVTQ